MPQPPTPHRSVGDAAVHHGMITRDQLRAAQAAQAQSPGRSLEQTLVDRKLLTVEQVKRLMQESGRNEVPAAAPPAHEPHGRQSHGTHRTVVVSAGSAVQSWILGTVIAVVPFLGIIAFLAVREKPSAPAVGGVRPTPTPQVSGPVKTDKAPKKDESPVTEAAQLENVRIRATLRKLAGRNDLSGRWNEAVDRLNALRDPEQYKPVLEELEVLVKNSRGTEQGEDIRDGYRDVLDAIKKRAEQIFGYISDEADRLKAAGKYGEAVKSWGWFPGNLDLAGSFQRRIEDLQKKTLVEARVYFGKLKDEVDFLIKVQKLDAAHLLLLRGLEVGVDELVDEAQKRLSALTLMKDAAIKKAEEERLALFEKEKAVEKEASKAAALYQAQFWELVARRNFEGAKAFLSKQRAGAPSEVEKAIDRMGQALEEIRGGFALVRDLLKPLAGRTVSLAFLEGGQELIRSFPLKTLRENLIVYTVEGRELTVPVSDLHSSEILKRAATAPKEDRDLLEGLAHLLEGGFDEAHVRLTSAGPRAQALVAFVENSTAFLERNATVMRERALRLVKDRAWEQAIQEYTKLASLPAERKEALRGRARAHYQMSNFMDAVLDIESLFEMDDFSETTIDLLNQTFKRSAMIEKVVAMYKKANEKAPQNVAVLANLVALYMQKHDFEEAKKALDLAQKLKGGGRELSGLANLVRLALEPAFPGKTFKAQFGRYDLETNVNQEYANRMAQFMNKVYESYVKVFPYKKNETLRFQLKLFATEGEFFTYYRRSTGADPVGPYGKILAYYMPVTKELVGWNADGIEATLQHEGLHQYLDYFISDCPIWFNEGYASFFETSVGDEVRFNIGRHMTAKWLFVQNQLPSMKEMFMMSGDTFRAKGAIHYGSSWSVVYWFVKSGRKQVLDRYFEALMEGKDAQQAFDAIFGPGKENVAELDAKWRKAIREENYDK